jgi:uncharacterized surface protein with fasciclin (FAS1) repeats
MEVFQKSSLSLNSFSSEEKMSMQFSKSLKTGTAVIALGTFGTALAGDVHRQGGQGQGGQQKPSEKDVVALVKGEKDLSILEKALVSAGLRATLLDAQSITLFAPTNEAFEALPEAQLAALLEDKEALKKVLLGHAVGAKLYRNTIMSVTGLRMIDGSTTEISMQDNAWKIEDSVLSAKSLKGANGIVYKIDKVLLPD